MEKKITHSEIYGIIKESAVAGNPIPENCVDLVVEFCDSQIEKLANKAVKAKERAAEKRAAGDELYAAVIGCLTSEPQTRDAIFAMLEGGDLTIAKVGARLSQAVANGVASKATEKVDGKNKVVYTLVVTD